MIISAHYEWSSVTLAEAGFKNNMRPSQSVLQGIVSMTLHSHAVTCEPSRVACNGAEQPLCYVCSYLR
jgi:hypothetical protein